MIKYSVLSIPAANKLHSTRNLLKKYMPVHIRSFLEVFHIQPMFSNAFIMETKKKETQEKHDSKAWRFYEEYIESTLC